MWAGREGAEKLGISYGVMLVWGYGRSGGENIERPGRETTDEGSLRRTACGEMGWGDAT